MADHRDLIAFDIGFGVRLCVPFVPLDQLTGGEQYANNHCVDNPSAFVEHLVN